MFVRSRIFALLFITRLVTLLVLLFYIILKGYNQSSRSLIDTKMTMIEMDLKDDCDIRDSFQALDLDHDGCLSTEEFYKLYLGLGFQPERIQLNDFQQMLELDTGTLLSVDDVLERLSKVKYRIRALLPFLVFGN